MIEDEMPHSFSNSERIRRQIKEFVEQKKQEAEKTEEPAKSESKARKTSKKNHRAAAVEKLVPTAAEKARRSGFRVVGGKKTGTGE